MNSQSSLPVIARKPIVNIIYKSAAIKMVIKSIAKDADAPSDTIRVRSLSTRRPFYAKVLDANIVKVINDWRLIPKIEIHLR